MKQERGLGLGVACPVPTCMAAPGAPCRNLVNGSERKFPHSSRVALDKRRRRFAAPSPVPVLPGEAEEVAARIEAERPAARRRFLRRIAYGGMRGLRDWLRPPDAGPDGCVAEELAPRSLTPRCGGGWWIR